MTEEDVMSEFMRLCADELNGCIYDVNERHDDGFVLPYFNGAVCDDKNLRPPFLRLNITGGEYTSSDVLCECAVYSLEIRIVSVSPFADFRAMARYRETLRDMLAAHRENDVWEDCAVTGWSGDTVTVRVVV